MQTNRVGKNARKRVEKAIELLGEAITVLGDGDNLERALAGVTEGMVDSPGHAKEATHLAFDARERLIDAIKAR